MDLTLSPHAARLAVTHPFELWDHMVSKFAHPDEGSAIRARTTHSRSLDAVHTLVGSRDCTVCSEQVLRVRQEVDKRLGGRHYHDGGPLLGEGLWAAVHHLRPEVVVETGVGRGISSAFMLDAMEHNGKGALWSIDLPDLRIGWSGLAPALPADGRARWHYLRGASRRVMPSLLRRIGPIDLFCHDGLHSYGNMQWEFSEAWPHLLPGGLLISDDIQDNAAFAEFADGLDQPKVAIAGNDDTINRVGLAGK